MSPVEVDGVVYRACRRKRDYDTRGEAIRAAVTVNRRSGRRHGDDGAVYAYACCFCPRFHVGHCPTIEAMHRLAEAVRELAAA